MEVGSAGPAAAAQQLGVAAVSVPGMALVDGKAASPSKVLDTYTAFNLAAQPAWNPPPVPVGSLPAPPLEIPGLRINAKPSSLLPPPAQVRCAASLAAQELCLPRPGVLSSADPRPLPLFSYRC